MDDVEQRRRKRKKERKKVGRIEEGRLHHDLTMSSDLISCRLSFLFPSLPLVCSSSLHDPLTIQPMQKGTHAHPCLHTHHKGQTNRDPDGERKRERRQETTHILIHPETHTHILPSFSTQSSSSLFMLCVNPSDNQIQISPSRFHLESNSEIIRKTTWLNLPLSLLHHLLTVHCQQDQSVTTVILLRSIMILSLSSSLSLFLLFPSSSSSCSSSSSLLLLHVFH